MDPEFADFVTGGGYDSAAIDAADDDRFACGFGVVALYNRCIERIHVNMKNSATTGSHGIGRLMKRFVHARRGKAQFRGWLPHRYLVTVTVIFFEITGGL